MSYTVHYGNLRTGSDISLLPVTSCTFGDELRGAGNFSASVAAGQTAGRDGKQPGALWRATRGANSFWAVEWADAGGRRIVAAGPIYARAATDDGITFGGGNMFTMLAHRKLVDPAWSDAAISATALVWYNLDLGSIMREIVSRVCTTPPGDLPIVLEPTRTGVNTRTYNGFDVATAADRIVELSNVQDGTGGLGGPDWQFIPRFKGDLTTAVDYTHVEWALMTGTAAHPAVPVVDVAPLVLDRGAPMQQTVGPVTVAEDASNLATHAFTAGAGTDKAKVIASTVDATLTGQGYPRMDVSETSNALDYGTVHASSAGLLARRRQIPQGVTVSVRASWWWAQTGRVGTQVRLIDPAHPVLGPIDLTSRVAKWSADVDTQWVALTLADAVTGL